MINIAEAIREVKNNFILTEKEDVLLKDASGFILAEDVKSPVDHPLFDQTAVDGYAFRYTDWKSGAFASGLTITEKIQAGDTKEITVKTGEAARIFTGAAMPEGADTVVMQELCELKDGKLIILDEKLKEGGNVRRQGEQIRRGTVAMEKGAKLNAGAIGFLASIGVDSVSVYRKPKTGILVTGNEFAKDREKLKRGEIFESNGIMLQASLQQMGLAAEVRSGIDDPELLSREFRALEAKNELLLITGGVSVGEYDFTRQVLEDLGYEIIFHKVNQKPGKPVLFARKGEKIVFGLPGNPRSVISCFYVYVRTWLLGSQGAAQAELPLVYAPLGQTVALKKGRDLISTVVFTPGGVVITAQESHMLSTFAKADGLAVFDGQKSEYSTDEIIPVYVLPM